MRIWYKASGFATNKTITAWFIKPDLTRTSLLTFTEYGEGLYYLDYDIESDGSEAHVSKVFEDGVPTIAEVFRKQRLRSIRPSRLR